MAKTSSSSTSSHTPPSPSASSTLSATSTITTIGGDSDSDTSLSSAVRFVRFDERCVLIREKPGLGHPSASRIATRTLEVNIPVGLPWRRPSSTATSPSPKDKAFEGIQEKTKCASGLPVGESSPPPVQHVVLKLPYPIFRRKSHSALQASIVCPPSCLRHSPSHSKPVSVSASPATSAFSRDTSPDARRLTPKRRSNSLPALPLDAEVETVPLRPCCEKCLAACEREIEMYATWRSSKRTATKKKVLPTLEESSREHTPVLTPRQSTSQLNLRQGIYTGKDADRGHAESGEEEEEEEDWCSGLHFTRGAYKLWRSASVDHAHSSKHSHGYYHAYAQEGSGSYDLLGSLVRVDEVDRKRGLSPTASLSALCPSSREKPTLNLEDLDRAKTQSLTATLKPPSSPLSSPAGSASGSEQEEEEELFPLPSPKRSPGASPSDSATCLPAQVSGSGNGTGSGSPVGREGTREGTVTPTEPRRLEAAIRAKMAKRERGGQTKASVSTSTSTSTRIRQRPAPVPIPGADLKPGVSHFCSHLDEIEWDPTGPDPDALPPDSTILLNSPPGSPTRERSRGRSGSSASSAHARDRRDGSVPRFSASVPSLHLHLPEIPIHVSRGNARQSSVPPPPNSTSSASPAPAPAPVPSTVPLPTSTAPATSANTSNPIPATPIPPIPIPPIPEHHTGSESRPTPRKASLSNIMRASSSMLRGLSLTNPGLGPGQSGSPPSGASASTSAPAATLPKGLFA